MHTSKLALHTRRLYSENCKNGTDAQSIRAAKSAGPSATLTQGKIIPGNVQYWVCYGRIKQIFLPVVMRDAVKIV